MYVNFNQNLTTFNAYTGGIGALIRIDNSSYLTNFQFDGISVSPGFQTRVSMTRSFKSILPQPYSNCLIDNQTNSGFHSSLFDLIQNSAYKYTQPFCFWQCSQRTVLKECNCTDPSIISLIPNSGQCLTSSEIRCLNWTWWNIIFENDFIENSCLVDCPLECYSDGFDVLLSSSELLPNYFFDHLRSSGSTILDDFVSNKIDLDIVKKSYVYLNIFYKELSYEISSESPQYNWVSLFANISSYLGFFFGVSLFSLFEIIQVLIEIVFMKLSSNRAHPMN